MAWLQVIVQHTANDFFLAHKRNAITRPVICINMCCTNTLEIETGFGGEGRVQISVHDRGCGIAPGEIERVFDAFFTTKPGGLGVGLALCRTIIQDHGGELTAVSRPGGGTTFTFSLRSADDREETPQPVSSAEEAEN